ncbi:MAG: chorismate mutase [Bryobacterales bacterium]|nr:chorismate mutase [Bryobacterales bacterium]
MEVSDWRERIDTIDRRLLELLNERVECVLRLSPLKRQAGLPVFSPEREKAVIEELKKLNKGELSDEAVERIFELIMAEMRFLQERERKRNPVSSHTE